MSALALPKGLEAIEDEAFQGCASLRAVCIPEQVGWLGRRCFADCTALEEASVPEGVESLEEEAFAGCESLRRVDLPVSLTLIEDRAFFDCPQLEDVQASDAVRLGQDVFALS